MNTSTLKAFLSQYSGRKIYFYPNPGNAGDAIINAASFQVFNELNIDFEIIDLHCKYNFSNDVLIYSGGGNFIEKYQQCADFVSHYHQKCKELIILPHTISAHTNLLKELKSNVTIFSREETTANYLNNLNLKCQLFSDHDMAFSLKPDLLKTYESSFPFQIYKFTIKNKLKAHKLNFRTLDAFRSDIEKTDITIPKANIDLSKMINYNYEMNHIDLINKTAADFIKTLSHYKTINTNRLHVSIVAGLLQKKVNLYNNSYWKNKAIFDYSISKLLPTVTFNN